MAPSQLKQLKSSLREKGVQAPPQSKQARRQARQNGQQNEIRRKRDAALQQIRQDFNPFDLRPVAKTKYHVVDRDEVTSGKIKGQARPGSAKSQGEAARRQTLLVEMQRRQKVGGLLDRRFGENDPSMAPEDRALQRYMQEQSKRQQKAAVFDLEDSADDDGGLTHLGQSLSFEAPHRIEQDDFDESSFSDEPAELLQRPGKRRRTSQEPDVERRKSKKEVMEEVIAKSKLHKYERQQAKEDDDDLRLELDKGLPELYGLLRDRPKPAEPAINPDRLTLLEGKDRAQADREYDERLRQMTMDQRAAPSMPTETEEAKLQKAAQKAKQIEQARLQRMRGEPDDSDLLDGDSDVDNRRQPLDVEDEEQFLIDNDYSSLEDDSTASEATATCDPTDFEPDLAACPQTHDDLLIWSRQDTLEKLPERVRNIRAMYHPQLAAENKEKLGTFAGVLVKHVAFLAKTDLQFDVVGALIRHIHSLAKTFPEKVATAFRDHLREIAQIREGKLTSADLVMLTAIGNIFPTSDHFHPVVSPAMLTMTRFLTEHVPHSVTEFCLSTYVSTLCLRYQQLARRYVPECLNFTMQTLDALSPAPGGVENILRFEDTFKNPTNPSELEFMVHKTHIDLAEAMARLWSDKPAFPEMMEPLLQRVRVIKSEQGEACVRAIEGLVQESLVRRKPLALHNHRPLAIRMSIPKFEDSYNPDRHYDPSPTRSSMAKLKAEHKKERKGAMRELRKDANFIARESLRQKKEKDAAYEKKYKRLVAEIQGAEGREANLYDQEKRLRRVRK